jgi:hypothetical protein
MNLRKVICLKKIFLERRKICGISEVVILTVSSKNTAL